MDLEKSTLAMVKKRSDINVAQIAVVAAPKGGLPWPGKASDSPRGSPGTSSRQVGMDTMQPARAPTQSRRQRALLDVPKPEYLFCHLIWAGLFEIALNAYRKWKAGTSPRRAAEEVARVSILKLQKAGLLQNCSSGVVVSYDCSAEEELLAVTYDGGVVKFGRWISVDDRFPEFHNELVEVQTVPKQFGGEQPYFVCNGCSTRRVYLYNADKRLRCRICIGLVHKSSQESVRGRSLRQARKIRRRLRCSEVLVDPPLPPKGMHQRTFDLQLAKLHRAEMRFFISISDRRWRNSRPSV